MGNYILLMPRDTARDILCKINFIYATTVSEYFANNTFPLLTIPRDNRLPIEHPRSRLFGFFS